MQGLCAGWWTLWAGALPTADWHRSGTRRWDRSRSGITFTAFGRDKICPQPITLVGASLGGAIAMDFAQEHPDAVSRLVLLDSQGYVDGLGALAKLPRFAVMLAVSVLKARSAGALSAMHGL